MVAAESERAGDQQRGTWERPECTLLPGSQRGRRTRAGLVAAAILLSLFATDGHAAQSPEQWVSSFWPTAKAAGVARSTYNNALGHFDPDPDVLKRAGAQPEFNTKIWNYLDQMVSDERLSEGKTAIAENSALLGRIEARYGVDRYIVAADLGDREPLRRRSSPTRGFSRTRSARWRRWRGRAAAWRNTAGSSWSPP